MNKIHLLDSYTINKIAAGEVVERPASVVKELIENSIDAKSSAITVEIKQGGTSLIRITDNGIGIRKDEVELAFIRHATNKIETVEDIFNISSMGFRGEALASIASVCQVEIITKINSDITGIRLEINGGEIISKEDIGCPNGTTIIIKNIFYNTPARLKFLKKPSIEGGYISDILTRLALGHPEISFKFINNGNICLHTSGNNNLKTAILNVYGKEIVTKLMDIDYSIDNYKITGLIGKPELSRSNRTYENLYINGRYIKSDLVKNAVEDAYKTRIMVGKFPVYIINLNLPAYEYDINVHPSKLEVRFKQENDIYTLVNTSINELFQTNKLIPKISIDNLSNQSITIQKELEFINSNDDFTNKENEIVDFDRESIVDKPYDIDYKKDDHNKHSNYLNKIIPDIHEQKSKYLEYIINNDFINQDIEKKEIELNTYKIIGQIFGTYWIIEYKNSIYMIDQHAAHEKILYQQFTDIYKNNKPMSQILFQPLTVQVSFKEKQILIDNLNIFKSLGFQIEEFGDNAYIIRAVPIIFDTPENIDFFIEILDTLNDDNINNIDMKFNKIASISCKAAVKAHHKLNEPEVKKLIENLFKLENPYSCPHGRPTIIEISRNEIEKKFKRI